MKTFKQILNEITNLPKKKQAVLDQITPTTTNKLRAARIGTINRQGSSRVVVFPKKPHDTVSVYIRHHYDQRQRIRYGDDKAVVVPGHVDIPVKLPVVHKVAKYDPTHADKYKLPGEPAMGVLQGVTESRVAHGHAAWPGRKNRKPDKDGHSVLRWIGKHPDGKDIYEHNPHGTVPPVLHLTGDGTVATVGRAKPFSDTKRADTKTFNRITGMEDLDAAAQWAESASALRDKQWKKKSPGAHQQLVDEFNRKLTSAGKRYAIGLSKMAENHGVDDFGHNNHGLYTIPELKYKNPETQKTETVPERKHVVLVDSGGTKTRKFKSQETFPQYRNHHERLADAIENRGGTLAHYGMIQPQYTPRFARKRKKI